MTDLPSGWSIIPLIDVIDEIMDYRGRTPRKLGLEWGGGDIKAISARNVRMGYVDFSVEHHLASETLYRRWMTHGDMREGDVLFTTEAPLGNVATVPDGRRYVLSQRTVLMRPKLAVLDRTYFLNLLQSPVFQQTLLENATGSTALGIQRARLEKLPLVVPPLPEQQQVGQAIQDSVELIHSMERLIAKKRAIKQGMMQLLLSGAARLGGFNAPWEERRIGDIASISKGAQLGRAHMIVGGSIPVWNGGVTPSGQTDAPNVLRQVVTISEGGNSCGWVGRPEGDFWLGGHCYALDPKGEGHSVAFLYHRLKAIEPELMALRVGSGLPNIQKQRLADFTLRVPTDAAEASSIAELLDDFDREIAAIERRRESARAIKQGMMQELLTGRTRLTEEVAA